MKSLSLTITLLIFANFSFAQDPKLPVESKELVDRLSTWELDMQAELQAKIKEKRVEVVKILEGHLKEVTRSGNLDGALAIRTKITELSENTADKPSVPSEDKATTDADLLIENTVWKGKTGRVSGFKLVILPDGLMRVYHAPDKYPDDGFWSSWRWMIEDGKLLVQDGAEKKAKDTKISRRHDEFHVPDWGDFELESREVWPPKNATD